MPRNGSGTFVLPAGNPVVPSTVIQSAWANTTMADLANGLTGSIAKDGQTVPTANLPMGTFRHTGVGAATQATHYARADQVQANTFDLLASVTGTNDYVGTLPLGTTTFTAGTKLTMLVPTTNTGACTLAVNGGPANPIKNGAGADLLAGEFVAGYWVTLVWSGTYWAASSGAYLPLTGGTITGNLGVTGNLAVNGTCTLGQTVNMAGASTTSLVALSTTVPAQWAMIGTYTAWGATPTLGTQPAASLGFQVMEAWTDSARGTNVIVQATKAGAAAQSLVAELSANGSILHSGLTLRETVGDAPANGRLTFGNTGAAYLNFDGTNFTLAGSSWFTVGGNLAVANALQYKTAQPVPGIWSIGASTTVNFSGGLVQILTLTVPGTVSFAGIPNGAILRTTFINTNFGLTITGVQWPNGATPNFATGPLKKAIVVIQNDGTHLLGTYTVY